MSFLIEMPLGARPHLVNCGVSDHGLRGREEYFMPKLWCLHLYFYRVDLEIDDIAYQVVPGTVTIIPPRRKIIYNFTAHHCRHFYVHFGLTGNQSPVKLPILQHLPEARDELFDRLQHIQAISTRNRPHAEIAFWSLLWDLSDAHSHQSSEGKRPLTTQMDELIEELLPGKLTVETLARKLEFSTRHINRTVQAKHGITAIQLIRKRRIEKAYRLLIHSTMPVKLVAMECGIPDVHQFNKLVHKEYGQSPRSLRKHFSAKNSKQTWALERE